jgi:hypothetical protein
MINRPLQLSYESAPPPEARGIRPGTASVVLSVLAPLTLSLTFPLGLFAAFFTRSENYSGGPLRWVMPAVMWSVPCLLGLAAVVSGVIALSKRTNAARILGVIGLSITALCAAGVALLSANFGMPLY